MDIRVQEERKTESEDKVKGEDELGGGSAALKEYSSMLPDPRQQRLAAG